MERHALHHHQHLVLRELALKVFVDHIQLLPREVAVDGDNYDVLRVQDNCRRRANKFDQIHSNSIDGATISKRQSHNVRGLSVQRKLELPMCAGYYCHADQTPE